ncbi:MAG: DUF378 domain-containing protein [Clostridia bacterium]|nr:DUF378 domain-containing protein [Clostridia bacterium]
MFTIIAFLLTILGCINWLLIGLLQYDFIAGIFGYQASIFSRIIYIIIGAASVFLIIKLIKNKGTLPVFSWRNKKDLVKNIKKMGHKKDKQELAHDNVETGSDYADEDLPMPPPSFNHDRPHQEPRGLFDEHFDERD